jgi:hypothetical protein
MFFLTSYWSFPLGNRNFLLTPSPFLSGDLFGFFFSQQSIDDKQLIVDKVVLINKDPYCMFYPRKSVYVRCVDPSVDPSVLTFSLSLYRHPSLGILCRSRFTSYNKQQPLKTRKGRNSLIGLVVSKTESEEP